MPVTYAQATDTGRVRAANEDALWAKPPVFMVADGMGGAQAGEVASGIVAKFFQWFLPQTKAPEEELKRLITRINENIYEVAGSKSIHRGMGTTVTAAALAGSIVGIAHVGDSRAYLWRAGRLRQLTEDHSLVAEMVRQGQISSEEARVHPQRSIITRALGVEPSVEVDTQSIAWQPGDLFLLASDGLYSMLTDSEIAATMAKGADLGVTTKALIESANLKGGHDNITVVLFAPDGSRPGQVETAEPAAPRLKEQLQKLKKAKLSPAPASAATEAGSGGPGLLARLHLGWFSTIPGRITAWLLLAVLVLGTGFTANRQIYFLGVEGDRVAIYRGFPYALGPWPLYTLQWQSQIKIDSLEPFEQERVTRQELHLTASEPEKIVENYSAQLRARRLEEQRKAEEAAAATEQSSSSGQTSSTLPAPTVGGH